MMKSCRNVSVAFASFAVPVVIGLAAAFFFLVYSEAGEVHNESCPLSRQDESLCEDFIRWRKEAYRSSGVTYSVKTGYLFEKDAENESTLNNCSIVEVYAVYRHGTRNPTKRHVPRYNELENQLKLLTAAARNLSYQPTKTFDEIRHWTNPFDLFSSGQMTSTGLKEEFCLGKRFKKRFDSLFVHPYTPTRYSFQSTFKSRTVQSASSFAHGVFEGQGPLHGYQPVVVNVNSQNDSLLRFFDNCKRYYITREKNKDVSEYGDSFLDQPIVETVRRSVQRKLDPGGSVWSITSDQVVAMYGVCSLELAIYGDSLWCSVFSEEESTILEYYTDFKQYITRSYGNKFNWQISCNLFSDILEHMRMAVSNEQQPTPDSPQPRVLLRFAHTETLVPLVSALGLYKDNVALLPTNHNDHKNRLFRGEKISPFSGNLAFSLYDCRNADSTANEDEVNAGSRYMVRILLNEEAVAIDHPLCQKEEPFFCPLDDFERIVNNVSSVNIFPCNFEELCYL